MSVLNSIINAVEVALIQQSARIQSCGISSKLDVVSPGGVYSLEQCRVAKTDNIGSNSHSWAQLLMQLLLIDNLRSLEMVEEPIPIRKLREKQSRDIIQGRKQPGKNIVEDEQGSTETCSLRERCEQLHDFCNPTLLEQKE